MGKIFGTDGTRGQANVDQTPELALALGRALVTILADEGESRPSIIVGRDPRWSGEMLESALIAGITSAGGDAITVGVAPTPAVAHLAAHTAASAGVVISASHNPVGDNGVKFFGPDGYKLSSRYEALLEQRALSADGPRPVGVQIGRRYADLTAVDRYIEHVVNAADTSLSGLKIVVDGANGAASTVAPDIYRRLGAEVVEIHCGPDGANINDCAGSTYPAEVCGAVVANGADAGISHDGDGDRLIAATHLGDEVDGDVILAILARQMHQQQTLKHNTVATTVMTNLGFRQAMRTLGIDVVETAVGDRYVLEAMLARDLNLGGEQSGHLIDLDHATTGDGMLSAVRLLSVIRSTGASLAELSQVFVRLPQILVNVRGVDKARLAATEAIWDVVHAEEARLDTHGRILLRASGTEPLVRVMAEADTSASAQQAVDRIAEAVRTHLTP